MSMFGKELILDLDKCDPTCFTRKSIRNYFKELCDLIKMERCKLCWWDDLYTQEDEKEIEDHLVGTSAVQFIKTSNITIHTLDKLQKVYINVFSCRDFSAEEVMKFSAEWFKGKIASARVVKRL